MRIACRPSLAPTTACPRDVRNRVRKLMIAASSSTTRMSSARPIGVCSAPFETASASVTGIASVSSAGAPTSGSRTVNSVPRPSSLCTSTTPPCSVTMLCTTLNPRPVPTPSSFVVKNGSQIRPSSDGEMPAPLSITFTTTNSLSSTTVAIFSSSGASAIARSPRIASSAWRAFTTRLSITCSSRPVSPCTKTGCSESTSWILTPRVSRA